MSIGDEALVTIRDCHRRVSGMVTDSPPVCMLRRPSRPSPSSLRVCRIRHPALGCSSSPWTINSGAHRELVLVSVSAAWSQPLRRDIGMLAGSHAPTSARVITPVIRVKDEPPTGRRSEDSCSVITPRDDARHPIRSTMLRRPRWKPDLPKTQHPPPRPVERVTVEVSLADILRQARLDTAAVGTHLLSGCDRPHRTWRCGAG